ncbi:MAG: alpha-glucosidase C-terminal domain-containing protein [Lachnospiraceae bacterium]|nr:alpha-glucosidase C-terminal domain-containing protein [Lachnospiraceae bacterium]
MAWYDEAIFYHIYPLGLLGAPPKNEYNGITHRLPSLDPWINHIKNLGCNALYIGPLFESEGHGYETTDYLKLDSRLGDNKDLKRLVKQCHKNKIKVIFDGVFNHTGRTFFAFKDIKEHREMSKYRDWYCNVNFYGNNEYNDGFSYDNWGGYNLLVKLNQRNPEVRDYICNVIRFWVKEFDIDGIRLDAADVLDFDFMKALRATANEVKPEFWLMGEVIHGDYTRWVNEGTLHSVTNYALHKALYSGHNDHNYFEIAHTVKRLYDMGGSRPEGLKLYNFTDNHDVERIYTKLNNKAHIIPVNILLYTLPGIPSVYYGSEFGIEGKKERYSDESLRPKLNIEDFDNALSENPITELISSLGKIRQSTPALSYGDYSQLLLTNRQYAFTRKYEGKDYIITVNNDDVPCSMTLPANGDDTYRGLLSGTEVSVKNGQIAVSVEGNSGDIWVPAKDKTPIKSGPSKKQKPKRDTVLTKPVNDMDRSENTAAADKTPPSQPGLPASSSASYEDGIIRGLQEAILARMEKNGPVTDQMRRDVENNIYHDSLINWIKSF